MKSNLEGPISVLIICIAACFIVVTIATYAVKYAVVEYKHKDIESYRCLNKYPPLPKSPIKKKRKRKRVKR